MSADARAACGSLENRLEAITVHVVGLTDLSAPPRDRRRATPALLRFAHAPVKLARVTRRSCLFDLTVFSKAKRTVPRPSLLSNQGNEREHCAAETEAGQQPALTARLKVGQRHAQRRFSRNSRLKRRPLQRAPSPRPVGALYERVAKARVRKPAGQRYIACTECLPAKWSATHEPRHTSEPARQRMLRCHYAARFRLCSNCGLAGESPARASRAKNRAACAHTMLLVTTAWFEQ